MGRPSPVTLTATKTRLALSDKLGEAVQVNAAQRLYVIPCGKGYTSLGFDFAEARRVAVLEWLRKPVEPVVVGTPEAYLAYALAMTAGAQHAGRTSTRCPIELTPQLVGLESKRVEVVDAYGEKRRFTVGRSTGWMPCHVEIKTSRSTGGAAVTGAPFASVKVL